MAKQTVTFMNGVSKAWAKALLTELFKGQSKFSVLPFEATKQATGANAGGIKWAGLNFQGADEIFTIKDSFTSSKDDDSTEKIQIDQYSGETIDTSITERGEWSFEGNIPVITSEYCDIFYDAGATITHGEDTAVYGQTGTEYVGKAYGMESKEVYGTILIENEAVTRGLAFARVKMTITPVFESGSPAYLKLKGTILGNPEASGQQGAWAVLNKYTA